MDRSSCLDHNPQDRLEREILQLYDSYAARLERYALALARDEGIAQDAVQEAFLRYSLMIKEGRSISAPGPWLFRVARNYLLDLVKAAHSQNEIGMDRVPEALARSADPEQLYASAELSRRIESALAPRELECLRLRSAGLRYHEIADVLSIRPGTVSCLLARCNARIQRLVSPQRRGASQRARLPAEEPYAS